MSQTTVDSYDLELGQQQMAVASCGAELSSIVLPTESSQLGQQPTTVATYDLELRQPQRTVESGVHVMDPSENASAPMEGSERVRH